MTCKKFKGSLKLVVLGAAGGLSSSLYVGTLMPYGSYQKRGGCGRTGNKCAQSGTRGEGSHWDSRSIASKFGAWARKRVV